MEVKESVNEPITPKTEVKDLLMSQKFGVVATQDQDHPYLSLVAFAETEDLRNILFATGRATRKYGNIASNAGVSLLVDNRANEAEDIREAKAVTIMGKAGEAVNAERKEWEKLYLAKQPHMEEFLRAPSTALIKVDVESYILVTRFQNVSILEITS